MLDNLAYRHTLRICNIYYIQTATIVTRMPLDVTLYINGLSCYCLKTIKTDKSGLFFLSAVLFSYLNENKQTVTPCSNKCKCVFYIALIAWTVRLHARCS
jgi:hypothetical protein